MAPADEIVYCLVNITFIGLTGWFSTGTITIPLFRTAAPTVVVQPAFYMFTFKLTLTFMFRFIFA